MRAFYVGVFCLGCVAHFSGCRPAGPPGVNQPAPTETFAHEASHFRFPPAVGSFARETVKQYDKEGMNISVGYNLGQSVAMTVYIYPIPGGEPDNTVEGHFRTCKREIVANHNGVGPTSEGPVAAAAGGKMRNGFHAVFDFTQVFAQRQQAVRSELYLFEFGRWFVKYRITYVASEQTTAETAINGFLEELTWPQPAAAAERGASRFYARR